MTCEEGAAAEQVAVHLSNTTTLRTSKGQDPQGTGIQDKIRPARSWDGETRDKAAAADPGRGRWRATEQGPRRPRDGRTGDRPGGGMLGQTAKLQSPGRTRDQGGDARRTDEEHPRRIVFVDGERSHVQVHRRLDGTLIHLPTSIHNPRSPTRLCSYYSVALAQKLPAYAQKLLRCLLIFIRGGPFIPA